MATIVAFEPMSITPPAKSNGAGARIARKKMPSRDHASDGLARTMDPRLAWLASEDIFLPPELAKSLRSIFQRVHAPDARLQHHENGPNTIRTVWTWIGIPALICALASIAIVTRHDADNSRPHGRENNPAASSLAGPSTVHPPSVRDARVQPQSGPPLELVRTNETTRVQRRLADLGFFAGTPNGPWGPRSGQALRQFKSANGLAADDAWDEQTEARLFAPDARRKTAALARTASADPGRVLEASDAPSPNTAVGPRKPADADTFIGRWASNAADCQMRQTSGVSLRIGLRGSEGYGGACSFGPVRRGGGGWHVKAACSADGIIWNANVSLRVAGDRLIWSSERGTTTYVRCRSS